MGYSASTIHRDFALSFVPSSNDATERILFDIDVNSNVCSVTKLFANIAAKSTIPDEDGVLFMLGSIFRIKNIVQQKDGICLIQMCLCSDNDHDLKPLFMHLQYDGNNSVNDFVQFGMHLREDAYYDEAERSYQRALEDLNDDSSSSNLINLAV
ncbi:unnamed protein product [Rotaria magnacalcarata]|uniref:Uncharacterized protein n=2 Tax=Rotaria magnacalcarata TaxID=392030 RepID=A0A8S2QF54_9BILA|nr:unnamed protein product [Rotaria magnacalcarata]